MKNKKEVQAAKAEIKKSIRMALGKERLNRYFKRRNEKLTTAVQDFANVIFDDAVEKSRHKFLLKFDDIVDDYLVKIAKEPVMTENYFTEDIYTQVARSMGIDRPAVKKLMFEEPQNFFQNPEGKYYPKTKKLVMVCNDERNVNDLVVYTEDIAGRSPSSFSTMSDESGKETEWRAYSHFMYRRSESNIIQSIMSNVNDDAGMDIILGEETIEYTVWID